jgi:hypothetical protein
MVGAGIGLLPMELHVKPVTVVIERFLWCLINDWHSTAPDYV